jgi:hypothetical protein
MTGLSAGASAVEEILKREKSRSLRVLVVWEPILRSDWSRPTRPVLARISDPRAKQFWDKDHLIANWTNNCPLFSQAVAVTKAYSGT